MEKKIIFLIFWFIAAALIQPQLCLAASHPYLLLNATEISQLKTKLQQEPFTSAFSHLTDAADWQNALLGASLKFLLTGNNAYYQQAISWLNNALVDPELDPETTTANTWDYGGWVRTYALVYDWLYPKLETSNPVVLDSLQQELQRWIEKLVSATPGGLYLVSGNGVPARTNGTITAYGGLGLAILALENEVSFDSQWLTKVKQRVKNDAFSLAGPAGNYQEGFHYQAFGLPKALTFAAAYQELKGEDLISGTSLEKLINWFLYSQTSAAKLLTYADPSGNRRTALLAGEYVYLIKKNQDEVGKWFWHQAHSAGWQNKPPFYDEFYYPAILLWYPQNLASAPPEQKNYPQSFFFKESLSSELGNQQAGLVVLRNGFGSEALVFSLINRFTYQTHQHYDPLSFTLAAYGEELIVDLMPHSYQQADRGANHEHNLVAIDLPDWEAINAGDSATGLPFYGRHASQLGFMEKFFTDPAFDFAKADGRYPYADISKNKFGAITSEYAQIPLEEITPIQKALRSIMFVKDPVHPYLIINDDLQKDNDFHDYSWLLHTSFTNISGQGRINNPLTINTGQQSLMIYFFSPQAFSSRVVNYLNHHQVIEIEKTQSVNAYFSALLYPQKPSQPAPIISQQIGQLIVGEIVWPEAIDYCLYNQQPGVASATGQFTTDSSQAWVQFVGDLPEKYFAENVNLLKKEGVDLIKINSGEEVDVFYNGAEIKIEGENFGGGVFLAPKANSVLVNGQAASFSRNGNDVFVAGADVTPPPSLKEIISRYSQANGADQNRDGLVNGLDFGARL